ncbi:hypothetical protein BDN72DRAFT_518205 [Pluteus cervinus]|uniref:Uncharacterized protein n=1 Tax=Pluteus cervinus TaxID=181527 RepID=A0ACD3BAS4_9AGAR|nr:hypothetical protein BDN72DRAFT_518205 [Pluteus cervinus]
MNKGQVASITKLSTACCVYFQQCHIITVLQVLATGNFALKKRSTLTVATAGTILTVANVNNLSRRMKGYISIVEFASTIFTALNVNGCS